QRTRYKMTKIFRLTGLLRCKQSSALFLLIYPRPTATSLSPHGRITIYDSKAQQRIDNQQFLKVHTKT
ncbi:hypothetical protein, partial [Acinetobacter sp. AS167]|uniref:hypothetical protein n=1 Tax=Acinetobacter sp. AS167 TaxID=3127884 RepID=UPI003018C4FD